MQRLCFRNKRAIIMYNIVRNMENTNNITAEILELHNKYPNNMEFGSCVRQLVYNMLDNKD
jgi:hypothetical protein